MQCSTYKIHNDMYIHFFTSVYIRIYGPIVIVRFGKSEASSIMMVTNDICKLFHLVDTFITYLSVGFLIKNMNLNLGLSVYSVWGVMKAGSPAFKWLPGTMFQLRSSQK